MAQITPLNTTLEEKVEGESEDITFGYQLLADETFKSINIIDYQPTPGMNVSGARLYGTYQSVFSFSGDVLKYRQGDQIKSASAWEQLPPPSEADLFLWKAPKSLERTFTYTVELIYMWQPPEVPPATEGGSAVVPEPVEKKIQQVYSQRVVGNWSKWANQLRNYVYAGT